MQKSFPNSAAPKLWRRCPHRAAHRRGVSELAHASPRRAEDSVARPAPGASRASSTPPALWTAPAERQRRRRSRPRQAVPHAKSAKVAKVRTPFPPSRPLRSLREASSGWNTLTRSKAVSPLRSATAVHISLGPAPHSSDQHSSDFSSPAPAPAESQGNEDGEL